MTREEAAAAMREIEKNDDWEERHAQADELMLTILREHGYAEVVKIWESMRKWFA